MLRFLRPRATFGVGGSLLHAPTSARRWLSASVLVLLGCERAPGPVDEAYCEGLCERREECDDEVDDCFDRCMETSPALSAMRHEAGPAVYECVKDTACGELADGLGECFERAGSWLDPSARQQSFCRALPEYAFTCGWYASPDDCMRWHGVWNDEVTLSLESCLTLGCGRFDSCAGEIIEGVER